MANSMPVPDNSSRELLVRVGARVLFGWLTPEEAQSMFEQSANNTDLISQHAMMVNKVQKRAPYTPSSPLVKPRGRWSLKEIAQREDLATNFRGSNWRPAVVDLTKVLAFQKTVRLPGLDERIQELEDDNDSILKLCIPPEGPTTPFTWLTDADGKGITLSSFNPNFRVYETVMGTATIPADPDSPPIKRDAVFVTYGAPPSYVHIACFRGRYFLRDGYHRAVALLRAGITEVPCVLIEVNSVAQIFSAAGNFVTQDVMMGLHPPMLGDFINDQVSSDGESTEFRRIIRIRGDEFAVPS